MAKPRVNYILATWSGKRRVGHSEKGDLTYQHFQYLEKIDHGLSQITVGWPENPKDSKKYRDWMKSIDGTKVGGATVVVQQMPNRGYSYDQYSQIFQKHNDFDHFIFTEDDYVPVSHHFDSQMVKFYDQARHENNCGYLCGLVEMVGFRKKSRQRQGYKNLQALHAAVSWGVTSRDVLEDVIDTEKKRPFARMRLHDQIAFSFCFTDKGYTLQDILSTHCCPYWKGPNIEYYGDRNKPVLIAPIQYAVKNSLFDVVPQNPFTSL